MAENTNSNQKRPGEKKQGKFHYNPGNMSGKEAEICKDEDEREDKEDQTQRHREQQQKR